MSSYIKLIIFILALLLISAGVIFIDSSLENINNSMPDISKGIVKGDKNYNKSVELLNNKYYHKALEKANSAEDYFNSSLEKLNMINLTKDINKVQKEYIENAIYEIQLKLKAVKSLKKAINYYEDYYNSTGNNHALKANNYMDKSLQYQDSRNRLVTQNPNLFKVR